MNKYIIDLLYSTNTQIVALKFRLFFGGKIHKK